VHVVDDHGVEFDWVYALDEGNPVLRPVAGLASASVKTGLRPLMKLVGEDTKH
jgi:hypothetical protein